MRIFLATAALALLAVPVKLSAAEQGRGWGSSWTTPHSSEEKAARDLDLRMKKALKANDWATVASLLEQGRKLNPNSIQLAYSSAMVAMKRQRYNDAATVLTQVLTLPAVRSSNHLSSEVCAQRAYIYALQGSYRASRDDLERAIALDKTNLHAHNNYAWLLATCPDASVRDGQRALSFARGLNQKSNSAMELDTLAAAQAETGDLKGAVQTEKRAIAAAKRDNGAVYQQHLQIFQGGRAIHAPPDRPIINLTNKS